MFYSTCVLSVVVYLIGGVPRIGPRVPFALLPFRHYPIKYLKQNKTLPVLPLLNRSINYRLLYYRVIITPQTGVLLQKRVKIQVYFYNFIPTDVVAKDSLLAMIKNPKFKSSETKNDQIFTV
jgi:hypothetical protein